MTKKYTVDELIKLGDDVLKQEYSLLLRDYKLLEERYELLSKLYKRNTIQLIKYQQRLIDDLTGKSNSEFYKLIEEYESRI